ncbi:MAG: ABC transporter permease [Eubacteriales bacterium]|nr:ABC transporter permease [Lachnospiraceae bacterium]MDO5127894.1 ABC transporter permease [Eubacteriales bacterium]
MKIQKKQRRNVACLERQVSKMKQFKTILKFELDNYFKSKSFVISTIIICLLSVGLMFVPRVIDSFKDSDSKKEQQEDGEATDDLTKYALYDATGIADMDELKAVFPDIEFVLCNSKQEAMDLVTDETAKRGFAINSLTDFDYYVMNKGLMDTTAETFREYMSTLIKLDYCQKNNLDVDEFLAMEYTEIQVNEEILGKDSASNYWYCYVLVILIFMLIIMYGTTIASGITNEKSNRSIEILVTSTSSSAILFGKVIAGVIAAVFQVGTIGVCLIGSYQFNKDYLAIGLSNIFNIPANVLITFAIFGLGGFLIYAFMYGALGALVSKIEDLNKSAGTAQMVVMIVYMLVLINLQNVDGIIIKVCSFLPVSSYSAMFARVAMGNVALWEIVVSAILLYVSVILVGLLGGKIFRNSTLRYGNPIKLSNAIKGIRRKN